MKRQSLDRQLDDRATLEQVVMAWTGKRNSACQRLDWRFTTSGARIKLARRYPDFEP